MKTTVIIPLLAALCLTAFAGEPPKPQPVNPPAPELFKAGEFTLDLAATYSDAKAKFDDTFDHSARGGVYGVSVGAAYWLTKNVGLGVDGVIPDYHNVERYVFGNANVSGILRYPIKNLAPYALGGIGRNFTAGDYTVHAGAGVEYRFTENIGAFAEGRYVWAFDRSPEYAQARLGIRFAF